MDRLRAALMDELDSVVGVLETASPELWGRPTRCRPWTVRELAAHLAIPAAALANGLAALQAGASTSTGGEPLPSDTTPAAVVTALRDRRERLSVELERVQPEQLDQPLPPPPDGGMRLPASTLMQLALVEIGVHCHDLFAALGRAGDLGDAVVEAIAATVPTWLLFAAAEAPQPDRPVSYRLEGERLRLSFTFEPPSGWALEEGRSPTCQIKGTDTSVGLFLLGRIAANAGVLDVTGDGAADFKRYLPGP